ncbi:chromosome segregation protein SMC [Desulfatitalea alkaliphila]|uniref:Chromosome partition protein Smc n=1 Tax=Desulfatitalea alkaliphila TaxID=2929485 RepID=A0AA41R1I8_9BACT|nr:chromosome segregation protein SMC [Desulfatitalea alkaliphila]MCJ8499986.1 chromosome segregation protein SMC [Desulfatitalea alkaliphila]
MKIKKLEIVGFKSFLDKASIQFPEGISAIVGPNGCGKSNVIDALRWVMGEQSVKQLRGKSMEDIIFAGANGRPPLNMAEVTLTMTNDNGHAPEAFRDYSEISVTRRLYRSGESAYLINKQPCRLKDIYNLFMGSGVGTRTFAIIQQGNIGAIVDAGPDERRLFIEEAAGVTRYKFRKTEALRKVKATEQNLLRINDIVAEVNRQMAGLRRQAKTAERYKQYQERFKAIDTRLLIHSYDDYSRQIAEAESLLAELKDADLAHVTQLKKIDAAVEAIKLQRWQKNQEIATQKSQHFELQRNIDRIETERGHLNGDAERLGGEITALEQAHADLRAKTVTMGSEVEQVTARNQQVREEIACAKETLDQDRGSAQGLQERMQRLHQAAETHKNDLMHLVAEEARYKNTYLNATNNKESLKRRLKRIDEELVLADKQVADLEKNRAEEQNAMEEIRVTMGRCETRIRELKEALAQASTELGAQVKKTQTLDLERNKVRSQLATLKKMAANFDWYRDGVKAIMQARRGDDEAAADAPGGALEGILGLMADLVEPSPGYENAVEAVLGEALQYVIVQDQQSGAAAIDYLQSSGAGRGGFLPVAGLKPLANGNAPTVDPSLRLLNHVVVRPEGQTIAEALLGHVAVVTTLDDALQLFNRNGRVQTIVTRQGDVVSHQGVLIGGSREQLSGILAKKQELKQLAARDEAIEGELAEAQHRQQDLEAEVRRIETALQTAIAEKNGAADEALDVEKNLYRLGEDLKNARRRLEINRLEQEQMLGEESDLDEEMGKYNQALEKIAVEVQQVQQHTTDTNQEINRLTAQLEAHNQKVVDLKLELTSLQAKLENGSNTLQRLKAFERDSQTRLEQLRLEIHQKKEKRIATAAKLESQETKLQQLYATLRELEQTLAGNETEYSAIDETIRESDEQQAAIQSEREKTVEKMRFMEVDLSEKRIKRDNIAGKAQERYHATIAVLRAQQSASDTAQMSDAEMSDELDRLRTKIANIGDVNLGAIKEYEVLKERFDFLGTQRDDLVKAIEDLHKVIRKINRITQERFMDTFEQVNAKLMEVFPKLFEGGSARLELTEPGKPLETGVEYMVHPPGKKLTRMSLLSGGEKALSAIAFIFAIFLIRPTSFCLLDEIDAPLDEANVIRFNNLMRMIGERSQIIMITHNKKSMEFAETLFGVTMEHKGISKVVSVNLQAQAA